MKFNYKTTNKPNEPIILLEISNNNGKQKSETGKIDTGASITAIPNRIVDELGLLPVRTIDVMTADNRSVLVDMYFVRIRINDIKFKQMKVVGLDRDNVLIGLDLINLWTLTLDGKNSQGKIDVWSTNPSNAYK